MYFLFFNCNIKYQLIGERTSNRSKNRSKKEMGTVDRKLTLFSFAEIKLYLPAFIRLGHLVIPRQS